MNAEIIVEIDPVIRRLELQRHLGVTSDTMRCWIRDGKLPEPDVWLSLKTRGWHLSTLRNAGVNWLQLATPPPIRSQRCNEIPMDASDPDPLIKRQELQRRLDVCSETLRRWMRDGVLPKPDVHLTREAIAWRLSTLRAAGINLP